MHVYLVRHAMSQWQVDPVAGLDSGLSSVGEVQAVYLADWAGSRPRLGPHQRFEPARLFVSPLCRARLTAAALAERLGVPAETCEYLAEPPLSVGTLLPAPTGPLCPRQATPPDVRYADVKHRAQRALKVLVEAAEDSAGGVVAVGHGGVIKTLLRCLFDSDVVCFDLLNTAIVGLEWTRTRWRLTHMNLCEHLPIDLRT
ncbi:MAG: histidine phosphatase family protein [Trebonia sp.]